MVPQLHAKYKRKNWTNPEKNAIVMDKWTKWVPLGLFSPFSGKQEFPPQNSTPSVLSNYGPTTKT